MQSHCEDCSPLNQTKFLMKMCPLLWGCLSKILSKLVVVQGRQNSELESRRVTATLRPLARPSVTVCGPCALCGGSRAAEPRVLASDRVAASRLFSPVSRAQLQQLQRRRRRDPPRTGGRYVFSRARQAVCARLGECCLGPRPAQSGAAHGGQKRRRRPLGIVRRASQAAT